MKRHHHSVTTLQSPDWVIAALVVGLVAFGVLMVFDASVVEAYTQFNDKFHFAKLQLGWGGLGLIGMAVAAFFPLKLVESYAKPAFMVTLGLLCAVLIPGIGHKLQGARRWLSIGFVGLQPSELAKLSASVYLASWLKHHQRLQPFLGLIGVLTLLLMLEPDLGTAIILISTAFVTYFLSGAPVKHILIIIGSGLVVGLMLIFSSPYRTHRLTTFLDPTNDPLGTSYHIRQVLIGIGSGGLTGTGIGRSRQKYQYLPEATTDSIFAVMAEEVGFIGVSLVLIAYATLIIRGYRLVGRISDPFAQLLAGSLTSWIAVQTLLNLSAMVALVPLTGIPLPFVSYGGSSLVTTMTAMGLLVNTSRYRR